MYSKRNLKNLTKNCNLISNLNRVEQCNVYIVTVPTPINDDKTPDLKPLISSSELVGSIIKKGLNSYI
jgi:UDP-N-acetyl-D-galactosamine dehydrogenase